MTPPATAPTATDASSGGANRPTARPTPPPQPSPLRPRWSPVWRTETLPSSLVGDQDHALDLHLLVLDQRDERLEVLRRLIDLLVAGDQHIRRCISHHDSPFSDHRGRSERRTIGSWDRSSGLINAPPDKSASMVSFATLRARFQRSVTRSSPDRASQGCEERELPHCSRLRTRTCATRIPRRSLSPTGRGFAERPVRHQRPVSAVTCRT